MTPPTRRLYVTKHGTVATMETRHIGTRRGADDEPLQIRGSHLTQTQVRTPDLSQAEPRCAVCGRPLPGTPTVPEWRARQRRLGTQRPYPTVWSCSRACRLQLPRPSRARPRPTLTCAICQQPFTPRRRDAITCSPVCRQRAYRTRKEDTANT